MRNTEPLKTHTLDKYKILVNGEYKELQAYSITHAWEQIKEQDKINSVAIFKQGRWIELDIKQ